MPASLNDRLATLTTMRAAELRAEWERVYRAPAPPLTADLLRRGIAWRLQERVHGGLPTAIARELQRLKRQYERSGTISVNVNDGRIKPGTRLVREWGGASHHVLVLESGYQYRDRRYSSLSQIARDITGAHWSGPRFFGLKRGSADA
ncbi:DUF2924 domain-containing protein [Sphingomonas sp. AOB5]|uniref:DUF2924 domain-containing protein n=1 Tax=Sphingomonas sp. AOB5 TaxID=3034017 RepID=UPI0023F617E4|nr:DUF2924 domain-containing protein [Sphingomonas sp. AOB5]MDF7773633.1 DUF2924 domain-containing protein [Sphingomonas sp. AOB5]